MSRSTVLAPVNAVTGAPMTPPIPDTISPPGTSGALRSRHGDDRPDGFPAGQHAERGGHVAQRVLMRGERLGGDRPRGAHGDHGGGGIWGGGGKKGEE